MRGKRYVGKAWLLCALCGLLVWGGGEASSGEKGGEVFAVLVGVNRYRSRKIDALKYTERDVRGLYGVLTGEGGVPRRNVRMLLNEGATKATIRYALKVWLKQKVRSVGKRAKVVVYFSGHGYAQSGTSYWLPHDARVKDAQSIEDTGISSDHVNSWLSLRELGSRSVVVLVDACNSGFAWSGTRTLQKTLRKQLRKGFKSGVGGTGFGEGHAVIASSMQDQYSVEAEELKHGVFSYALMEGLRGKADFNRDGKVTLPEVWAYLSYRVKALAQKYKRYPQVPVKSGPEAGEMVLSFPKVSGAASEGGVGTPSRGGEGGGPSRGGEGVLVLSASVGGVKVYVDGRYRVYLRKGQSKRLKLPSGKHTVVFQKSGYVEKKEEIELDGGGELPLEGTLLKEGAVGRVEQPTLPSSSAIPWGPFTEPRPTVVSGQRSQGSTPKAGDRKTFMAGGVEFAMRWIPAGSFVMGSPSDEAGRFENEGPQRRVRISKGFWMLESEVTQGQYKALAGLNPSFFKGCGENCPVDNVTWADAREFANKLSSAEGLKACTTTGRGIFGCRGWRLPTEAEWEYAARAGTVGSRYGTLDDAAWYAANSETKVHPVGGKTENRWGLKDMLGNVIEWTMDVYDSYAGMATQDPIRKSGHSERVVRGGCWANEARYVRSAFRGGAPSSKSFPFVGFRLLKY